MPNLTANEITALIGKIKNFPYVVTGGTTNFGPLSGAPSIEADVETKDVTLYETNGDVEASMLTKNNVKVTINTRNVDDAIALLSAFAKGDNVYDSSRKVSLTFVPITSGSGEKTITFSNAYLQPGLSYTVGEESNPSEVALTYICKADATTGKPFTYSV